MNQVATGEIWLWLNEAQSGPFSLEDTVEMAKYGHVDRNTMFFDSTVGDWRPLAEFLRGRNEERLAYLQSAGLGAVQIVAGGQGDECPVCSELLDQIFPISSAPALPPEGCTCNPWCKAGYIASR